MSAKLEAFHRSAPAQLGRGGQGDSHSIILRRTLLTILWIIPAVMLAVSTPPLIEQLTIHVMDLTKLSWQFYLSNLRYAYEIFRFDGRDSWVPMLAARQWLAANPGQDVYQAIFFTQGVKFQYPCTALLFIEWVRAEGPRAMLILNLFNTAFFAATIGGMVLLALALAERFQILALRNDRRNRILLAAVAAMAALCFYPLISAVSLGQIQVILDALFVFACYSCLLDKKMTAGVLIGISTLIKPQMALFLLWGLIRRDHRFTVGWLLPVIIGAVASALLYGPFWPLGYLKVLAFIGSHGESFFPNQSVNGLVHRLLLNGPNLEWEPDKFPPYNPIVHAATLVSSAMLVVTGLAFGIRHASDGQRMISLAFAGLCFTMASPVAWEHHYGVMLPLFAFCLVALLDAKPQPGLSSRPDWSLLGIAFFLAANSISVTNWATASPFNILQSYQLFAAFGMLGLTWAITSRLRRESAL